VHTDHICRRRGNPHCLHDESAFRVLVQCRTRPRSTHDCAPNAWNTPKTRVVQGLFDISSLNRTVGEQLLHS